MFATTNFKKESLLYNIDRQIFISIFLLLTIAYSFIELTLNYMVRLVGLGGLVRLVNARGEQKK
jgi:hypothetical protein